MNMRRAILFLVFPGYVLSLPALARPPLDVCFKLLRDAVYAEGVGILEKNVGEFASQGCEAYRVTDIAVRDRGAQNKPEVWLSLLHDQSRKRLEVMRAQSGRKGADVNSLIRNYTSFKPTFGGEWKGRVPQEQNILSPQRN